MKKITHLVLTFIAISSFASFSNSVFAQKKIAYITDPVQATYANDTKILPMLKADANFVVTEITATTSGQDLTGYDLIVLAEPAGSSASMVLACKGINKPVLNMKVFAYKTGTSTWAWATANADIIDNVTATSVIINKPSHPIFTGLTVSKGSEVQMLSTVAAKNLNGITAFANVTNGKIDTLATIKDALVGQLNMVEVPKGVSVNGTVINQKFIQIGISGTSYANVSTDGLKIIKNAVYYLTDLLTKVDNPISENTLKVSQLNNLLTVESAESLELSIFSLSGQRVRQTIGTSISTENLNKGIYFLQLKNKGNINQTIKFVK